MNKQQEKSIKGSGTYSFSAFPLYEHKTPVFKENQRTKIVDFGDNNDYPDYLSYLFNRSSLHAAIVRGKATYIFGKGWTIKDNYTTEIRAKAEKLMKSVNSIQTLDELSQDLIMDWLVYGGYALKITKVAGQIISVKHQPFNTVRAFEDCNEFVLSNEWTAEMSVDPRRRNLRGKLPDDAVDISKYNPTESDGKFLLYIRDPRPAMKVYPLPEYEPAIAAIETEIEVRNYDLNNVKSGFSAGTMITLFNGEPSADQKSEIEQDLKGKITGTDNAGEVIFNYQNVNVPEPKLINFRADNIADQFELLDPRIQQAIISGHNVTSGMLFGIKEQGQLGGRGELRTAWELFYNTYVRPKQIEFEKTINYIAELWGLPPCFELTQLEPLGIEINMEDVKTALGADKFSTYIAEKIGISIPEKKESEIILDTLNNLSPIVANKLMNSITVNELRAILQLPKVDGGDTISEPEVEESVQGFSRKQKFEAANAIILHKLTKELGESRDKYDVVIEGEGYNFDATSTLEGDNEKVFKYLKENPKSSLATMAGSLQIREAKLLQIIENLNKGNHIAVNYTQTNGKISVDTEINEAARTPDLKLETRWVYDWNNPNDANTISRSRDFCRELLRANRQYKRSEIDQLTNDMEDFNTDVWRYRGGWYHDPSLDVNLPQCRHYWKQILVRAKA